MALLALDLHSLEELLSKALRASAKCAVAPANFAIDISNLKIKAPIVGSTAVRFRLELHAARVIGSHVLVRYKIQHVLGLKFGGKIARSLLAMTGVGEKYGVHVRRETAIISLNKLREKKLLPEFISLEKLRLPTLEKQYLFMKFAVAGTA